MQISKKEISIARKCAKSIGEKIQELIIDEMNEHFDPSSQGDADTIYAEIKKQLPKFI